MEDNKTTYKFVEELGTNGRTFWYTTKNDGYVQQSLSYDKEEAKVFFENIVKTGKPYLNLKVLEEYVKED